LNNIDEKRLLQKQKDEIIHYFTFISQITPNSKLDMNILNSFDDNFFQDLHEIYTKYKKPIQLHGKIEIRNKIIPYVEAIEKQHIFLQEILKFYEAINDDDI
jgi:hypothetical protein